MKRILATATVGLSTLLTVGLGALRYKFVAVELGAPGVGLLGILTAAASFGVILFSLGISTSGVQATASAADDAVRFQRARAALLVGSCWLGGGGGLVVVILGLTMGSVFLPEAVDPVLVVSLGVALAAMVISGGQLALLNGMGRFRSMAASNAWGSVTGTVVTIAALYFSGQAGLISALAAAPLATLACTSWFVAREPKSYPRSTVKQWWPELRGMAKLGGVVMLGLLFGSGTQLAVRLWLERNQGLQIAGNYQAAWTITSMYLGFVLTALAVEYYPRISACSQNLTRLNESVDAQIRLALWLGAPVLLWMMVLSPSVLQILYASDFRAAEGILRWQLFGDFFKIVGWAVSFMLLARNARGAFFAAEFSFNISFLALSILLATKFGLSGFGMAYAAAYALYATVMIYLARRESGLVLRKTTMSLLGALIFVGGATLWSMQTASTPGLFVGIGLASAVSIGSILRLVRLRSDQRRSDDELPLNV